MAAAAKIMQSMLPSGTSTFSMLLIVTELELNIGSIDSESKSNVMHYQLVTNFHSVHTNIVTNWEASLNPSGFGFESQREHSR